MWCTTRHATSRSDIRRRRLFFLTMSRRIYLILLLCAVVGVMRAVEVPKREFRGAWLHTVYQDGYASRSTEENKRWLIDQLDCLQEAGINAVIFQVRPSADAFYDSKYEPWSRFLTKNGKAPSPYWDPLEFMVTECHARGMELHAWLNPYRATTSTKEHLNKHHPAHRHPERLIRFDKKYYFDPALEENRRLIVDVVTDIITRYDVDGIHFDDYFYPYPVKGKRFDDGKSYRKYGNGMSLGDWRRHNVDLLIESVHKAIRRIKPWVRFGISPFGIWRNAVSDPAGSNSSGLQNYDDLYADVLKWAKEGWIDYQMPQLYWTLENKVAPSLHLAEWWSRNGFDRHVYIGQDVDRTMQTRDLPPSREASQLRHKIMITRENDRLQGNCFWPGYYVTANHGGIADSLAADLHAFSALVPEYPWLSSEIPAAPKRLSINGRLLKWQTPKVSARINDPVRFVVYCFEENDEIDLGDPSAIMAVTPAGEYEIPADIPSGSIFIVTALNRVNNESDPSEFITYYQQ